MGACFHAHKRKIKQEKQVKSLIIKPQKDKINLTKLFTEKELKNKINNFVNNTIIQDSIFDKEDPEDSTYNQIMKEEKEELIKYFNSKQHIINNETTNFLKSKNLGFISNLSSEIISSENGKDIYNQKILREIEEINKNEESFKINNLTVFLVGKSGVGKSTLINKILQLEGEERARTGNGNFQTTSIKPYKSDRMPFLRLVDSRGIELNKNYGAEVIKNDAEKFIKEQLSTKDINNFVHCIWYCITGNRFEQVEIDLLNSLRSLYADNKIPIIIVYTQATDDETISEMAKYIKDQHIEGYYIKILAERKRLTNGTILEPFGLDELIKETLKKCRKALKGDMCSVMSNNISQEIEKILQKENSEFPSYIKEKAVLDFVDNYKVKKDEDFINYIVKIFGFNIEYFLEKKMNKNSESIFKESDFIKNNTQKYIEFYQDKTNNIISQDMTNLALQFLDLQSNKEKINQKPTLNKNKKNNKQFSEMSSKFLKDNFYYVAQKNYISFIIEKICLPLSKGFEENLNQIISNLFKEDFIKQKIDDCFLNKFSKFEERINEKGLTSKNINIYNTGNNINNIIPEETEEFDLPSYSKIITNNNINNNITNNINNNITNNNINNNMYNNTNNDMDINHGENQININNNNDNINSNGGNCNNQQNIDININNNSLTIKMLDNFLYPTKNNKNDKNIFINNENKNKNNIANGMNINNKNDNKKNALDAMKEKMSINSISFHNNGINNNNFNNNYNIISCNINMPKNNMNNNMNFNMNNNMKNNMSYNINSNMNFNMNNNMNNNMKFNMNNNMNYNMNNNINNK